MCYCYHWWLTALFDYHAAYKITKSHVDAIVSFASAEEAEAALASLHLDSSSDDDDDDAPTRARKARRSKLKKQSNHGNFSQFRNKTFNPARHSKRGEGAQDADEEEPPST